MDCKNLKQKYEELLTLQADFQALNAKFQQMKPNTVAERRAVSDDLSVRQREIEALIKNNFEEFFFVSIEKAGQIMNRGLELGKTHCFGPVMVERAFGIKMDKEKIPPIPFSKEELERANKAGKFLILRVDKDNNGKDLTMKNLVFMMDDNGYARELDSNGELKGEVVQPQYGSADWWDKEEIECRWALVDKGLLKNSTYKDYWQQTKILRNHIVEVYKDGVIPAEYLDAVKEFDEYEKSNFKGMGVKDVNLLLQRMNPRNYNEEIIKLKINQRARKTPAEELYDTLMYYQINCGRLNEEMSSWTNRRGQAGGYVFAGEFTDSGMYFKGLFLSNAFESIGVSSSITHSADYLRDLRKKIA